jgi:hypothetical protein
MNEVSQQLPQPPAHSSTSGYQYTNIPSSTSGQPFPRRLAARILGGQLRPTVRTPHHLPLFLEPTKQTNNPPHPFEPSAQQYPFKPRLTLIKQPPHQAHCRPRRRPLVHSLRRQRALGASRGPPLPRQIDHLLSRCHGFAIKASLTVTNMILHRLPIYCTYSSCLSGTVPRYLR